MTPVVGMILGVLLTLSMAQMSTQRILCGRNLADTLDIVCAGRGFNFNKRSAGAMPQPPQHVEEEGDKAAVAEAGPRTARSAGPAPARSIVDECCRRACSYEVLESYCAPANDGLTGSEEDLRRLFGVMNGPNRNSPAPSTVYTTTQSTAHYDSNSPSAEVFRGPPIGNGNGNGNPGRHQFFYVQLGGSRPTRNPLITE